MIAYTLLDSTLLYSGQQFMEKVDKWNMHKLSPAKMVVVTPTDTLRSLLSQLVDNKIHRVYVVNNTHDMHLQGVVTTSDLLRIFVGRTSKRTSS